MPRTNFEHEDSDAASTENLLKHPEDFIPHPWLKREPSKSWKLIALYATAATLYGLIATGGIVHLWLSRGGNLVYSPASPILEFETRVFDPHLRGDPNFFGSPSAEVDSNWQEVMSASTIHLSEADRKHFDSNLPMVQLPDGSYVGQLMVYHELHCLKRLYQYMNAEYYFPNLTQHDREMNKMHTEHCLGTLRQGVMCHSDVSVMPMIWGKHSAVPLGDFSSPHQCVNFDKLHAWALQRAVTNDLEPGVLVHPTLGPSFPEGKGTKIGFGDENIDDMGNIINLNSPDR